MILKENNVYPFLDSVRFKLDVLGVINNPLIFNETTFKSKNGKIILKFDDTGLPCFFQTENLKYSHEYKDVENISYGHAVSELSDKYFIDCNNIAELSDFLEFFLIFKDFKGFYYSDTFHTSKNFLENILNNMLSEIEKDKNFKLTAEIIRAYCIYDYSKYWGNVDSEYEILQQAENKKLGKFRFETESLIVERKRTDVNSKFSERNMLSFKKDVDYKEYFEKAFELSKYINNFILSGKLYMDFFDNEINISSSVFDTECLIFISEFSKKLKREVSVKFSNYPLLIVNGNVVTIYVLGYDVCSEHIDKLVNSVKNIKDFLVSINN